MTRVIILFSLMLVSLIVDGQSLYELELDLKDQWYFPNEEKHSLDSELSYANSVQFSLDQGTTKSQRYLEVSLPLQSYLFISGRLTVANNPMPTLMRYSLDSLFNEYGSQLDFNITSHKGIHLVDLQTKVVRRLPNARFRRDSFVVNELRPMNSKKSDVHMTFLVAIMISLAAARSLFRKPFREVFAVTNVFSVKPRVESLISTSVFSMSNLGLVVLYSLLVGGIAGMLAQLGKVNFFYSQLGLNDPEAYLVGLHTFLFAFVLMYLKYALVRFNTSVFKVAKSLDVHFFSYLRLSILLALIMFFMVNVGANVGVSSMLLSPRTQLLVLKILVFFRFVSTTLVLNKELPFRKLHLFIYLCATELIPQLVLLKLITN